MKSSSAVSCIIIFLNAEKYLDEAVESILRQTYRNWELLLVDDGSTDSSTDLARRHAAANPDRVRYLEHQGHQNRGMSAARNLGIRHARGEYLAFLDADDVWLPQKLERQVSILDAQPTAAMVYGNCLYWYSWTGTPENETRDHVPELGVRPGTLVHPPGLVPLFLMGKAAVPCACSILVRRRSLDTLGAFEESFRGMYEDQVFYAKISLNAPVFVSGECLERYRQHPDSVCSVTAQQGRLREARRRYLDWLAEYASQRGVEDAAVWRALRRARWLNEHPYLARVWRGALRWTEKPRG